MIDSHCHFDDERFAHDRKAALQRARAAGVDVQVIPGVTAMGWNGIRQLCSAHQGLYPAYGLHPMFLSSHQKQHLERLAQWLDTEPAVAVGECGLDYFVKNLDHSKQWVYFQAQIQLAIDFKLPLIIHARRAVDDVLKALRGFSQRGQVLSGVVHSFSGSLQQAEQLIDLGFYLSFGGPITYPRAQRLRHLVHVLPLQALLLETDAPDQPLSTHRGERNEPSYLPEVLATFAQLREEDVQTIESVTTKNAQRLFKLS